MWVYIYICITVYSRTWFFVILLFRHIFRQKYDDYNTSPDSQNKSKINNICSIENDIYYFKIYDKNRIIRN